MPRIATRPCHRAFLEFDASILDVAEGGAWLTRINIRACLRNPRLSDDLIRRCDAALRGYRDGTLGQLPGTGLWKDVLGDDGRPKIDPDTGKPRRRWIAPVVPLAYEDEPQDLWQAYSVMAEDRPGQTIRADCDCLSPLWACYFYVSGVAKRVGIGVSQPRVVEPCPWGKNLCGKGMAHEYTILDFGRDEDIPSGLLSLPGVFLMGEGIVIFDGSVLGGMGEEAPVSGPSRRGPPKTFYGAGESAHVWI